MRKCNDQLCWSCKNAYAGKCSWFTRYEPVENWIATPTIVKGYRPDSEDIPSFEILTCPQFDIEDNDTLLYARMNMSYAQNATFKVKRGGDIVILTINI